MAGDSKIKVRVLGDSADGQRAMREYARSVLEAQKATEQYNDKLSSVGKASLKVLGALPLVGMAAGAGVAAGLAAIPVALAAVAAFALSSNEEVKESFADLWSDIKATAQDGAAPLADTFIDMADDLRSTVQDIRPDLERMFVAAEPGLQHLNRGINDLVRNSIPGMVKAVEESEDTFEGLANLLSRAGTGISDFFRNISQGSKGTGILLTELGRIIQDLLGFAGSLLAKISNAFSGNFSQVADIIDTATDALEEFADGALPVLASAATAGLNALSGLLKILEPFSGVLGVAAAAMITASASGKALNLVWEGLSGAASLFSAKGGIATGLRNIATHADDAALKAAGFAEKITGSSKAGMGFVNAGTAVSGALNGIASSLPAVAGGLAVFALLAGTLVYQQEKLASSGDAIAVALSKEGSEARKAAEEIAKHKRELEAAAKANQSFTDAQDGLSDSAVAAANALYEKQKVVDQDKASWDKLLSTMTPVQQKQAELNRAIAEYGPNSQQAQAAGSAYRAEVERTGQAQRDAAEATKTHTDKMIEQHNQMMVMLGSDLAYRNAVNATADAERTAAKAISEKGASSEEAADAIRALEGAQLNQIRSAGELAAATYKGTNETERARLATEAMQRESLNLAAANNGALSPSLLNSIRNMNATQLQAMGVTARINETGQAVLRLPNGKTITLGMNDYANWPLQTAINNLSQIRDKTVTVRVNLVDGTRSSVNQSGQQFGTKFYAKGGSLVPQTPTVVGEEGPEMIWPNKRGYVTTAKETDDLFRAMMNTRALALGQGVAPMATPINSNVSTMTEVKQGDIVNISFGDIVTQAKDAAQLKRELVPMIEEELLRKSNRRTGKTGIS